MFLNTVTVIIIFLVIVGGVEADCLDQADCSLCVLMCMGVYRSGVLLMVYNNAAFSLYRTAHLIYRAYVYISVYVTEQPNGVHARILLSPLPLQA